jgi:hypothetical protein
MRRWNSVCTCIAIAAYVILITLFLSYENDYFSARDKNGKFNNCTYYTCLSFCEGADYEKFSDDFINENFPYESFPKFKRDNKSDDYTIIKHTVECEKPGEKKNTSNYDDWIIYGVRQLGDSADELNCAFSFLNLFSLKTCVRNELKSACVTQVTFVNIL